MAYLRAVVPGFSQVVAVDAHFDLFTRVWCVAELVEAMHLMLNQKVKIYSIDELVANVDTLQNIDVSKAKAFRQEDKDLILAKIGDIAHFNEELKDLVLHKDHGLLKAAVHVNVTNEALALLLTELVGVVR